MDVQDQLWAARRQVGNHEMRTLADRLRILVSGAALSVLAGVGSFTGTYHLLEFLSESGAAVAPPIATGSTGSATPHAILLPALPGHPEGSAGSPPITPSRG